MLHPPPTAPSSSSAYNFSSSSTSLYAIDGIGGTPQQQQPPSQQHSHNHIPGGVQHNHAPYQHNIGGGLLAPHDGGGGGVGNKRLRSGGAAGASPYGSPPSSPAGGGHMGGLHSHQHHAETTRESMAKLTKQTADHLTSLVALMESTDPEGLAASQLVLALDIVLRFNNKIGPAAGGGGAHGVKTGGGMVGATHSAHGLMPHSGASRPLTGLASSAPQSYGMPQPQALSQQQMYGLPASQTAPAQMYGSPQPLYSSAPAGMGQHQPHQQTRPSPNYPQFRAPTGAATMMNGAMTSTSTVAQTNQMPPSTLSLDYFMLLQTLGTGTFGQVRLCQQKATGKYFCLKILSKEKIVRLKQTEHVKSEKSVLAQISHPFIVKLYATFQDQANLYFLLEYISGGELFSCIRRNGRLSNSTARFYAAEIVLAIRYLHSLHIAHRDLKPENLLLDSDGHIKLSDFGFAKVITDKTWTMCGTPEYIAPEVILSKGHDKAVDWWSLGVLIYEMLSGKPPFHGEHTFEIFEKILSAKVDMPAYFHPEAKDLIEKLLVVDVAKRLGGTRGGGAEEVMSHPWFAGIDWDALHKRQLRAPINPGITGEGDSHNFPRYSDQTVEHKEFKENELFKDF